MNQIQNSDNFVVDFGIDPKTGREKHDYLLNGKPLNGVTSILKILGKGDALTQWSANLAAKSFSENVMDWLNTGMENLDMEFVIQTAKYKWKEELASAGKFGKNVHKAVEMFVKKESSVLALDTRELRAYENFKHWFENEKMVCLDSEKPVYSKTHWYAGTIDLILQDSLGKVWIADVKTSSSIYPEYFFQTAAYQCALLERGFDKPIEGHIIINVKKDGKVDIKKSYGYERNLKAFLCALEVFRTKQDLENELQIKRYSK